MAQTVREKAVCEKCGVDVRTNTTFCYNCGSRVGDEPDISFEETIHGLSPIEDDDGREKSVDAKTKAALDDLADQLRQGKEDDDRLAKAAAARRRARIVQRKPQEFKWEADQDSSSLRMLWGALLIAIIAGVIVLLAVVWR